MNLTKYCSVRSGNASGLVVAAVLLSGCSTGGLFGSPSNDPAPAGGSSPSFTDRFSSFFSGSGRQTATVPSTAGEPSHEIDCPTMDIRHGTGTMSIAGSGGEANATSLRYQLTLGRMARECVLVAGNVKMKVGVEGRVVLGPAGGPGQIEAPLRYAVVREGPEPKTIVTKVRRVPVVIGAGDANVPFADIDDDLTFPMPAKQTEFDAYVVYVGFDAAATKPQEPKKKPAPAPRPKR